MKKNSVLIQLLVVFGIVIVANLISRNMYFRIDFTEDDRYTLSQATKDILKDLDEVITVTAYFTEQLPAQLASARNDLRDILVEYEDLSSGNLVFEFVNPNETEESKQEAMQNGVAPISIQVIENDQRQQLQAFLGLVMKSGDKTESIPFLQPGAPVEFELTTAVKKISITNKPKVGFISGYSEQTLMQSQQLMEQLSVLYEVETFNIRDTTIVPSYFKSLIWINPTDTVDQADLMKLDNYLNEGGTMFLAHSTVRGDLQNSSLSPANDIGIRGWLGRKGVAFGSDFVIDANSATVNVQQRQGFFTINSQVNYHYFPKLQDFGDHPTTKGLEAVQLQFANNLQITNTDSAINITPLMFTSELSGTIRPPSRVNIQKKWTENDFPLQEQIMAASIEGIGKGNGRIVVIGSGDFIFNGDAQQTRAVNDDNVFFASNSVDWLSDDTGLINLRTKGITERPLDTIEDSTKNLLKWGNVLIPIILILIYAFIRTQARNRKKQQWMQGNFG